MTTTTSAVHDNGVFRPVQPSPFANGEAVQLTVSRPEVSPAEAPRRLQVAATSAEVSAGAAAAAEDNPGYDLPRALAENRKGERPLYPPAMKGISW
jgi:hypothetical protein